MLRIDCIDLNEAESSIPTKLRSIKRPVISAAAFEISSLPKRKAESSLAWKLGSFTSADKILSM